MAKTSMPSKSWSRRLAETVVGNHKKIITMETMKLNDPEVIALIITIITVSIGVFSYFIKTHYNLEKTRLQNEITSLKENNKHTFFEKQEEKELYIKEK